MASEEEPAPAIGIPGSSQRSKRSLVDGLIFNRVASGRAIKCLTLVDGATHKAVAVLPERGLGGDHLVRVLYAVYARRGKPMVIRTNNGKEFTGRAMQTWANRNGVLLRLIEPSKPNQSA